MAFEDVEASSLDDGDIEDEPLLPSQSPSLPPTPTKARFSLVHIVMAFLLGIIVEFFISRVTFGFIQVPLSSSSSTSPQSLLHAHSQFVPPYVGSTEIHQYPPAHPTNVDTSQFPSNVGHAGPTPTGAEPALLVTAPSYPTHSGAPGLLVPNSLAAGKTKFGHSFDLFRYWGNLSPWFSNEKGAFGVDSGPEPPDGCSVTGLHLLHRHGARYPTGYASYGGPSNLAARLHDAGEDWYADGDLSFLNDWTYKLGEEVLTPFGRQQLFDLGVSMRMKYGFLLKNFTETNTLPVFRTESQDRMVASAMNFALGFFGYPLDQMYEQSITVEAQGFNNTLAPYKTCPNADDPTKADRGSWYVKKWTATYLKGTQDRLNRWLHGLELTVEDVFTMQQMCAYETVAIGYSKFCEVFTQEEWEGFNYAMDLSFWYNSAFGSPISRALGVGYVQELVSRLTQTPIQEHNTSTNATLDDNNVTFPLDGRSLYVDATHEVVVLHVITALNLTNFAKAGPLPVDRIPEDRSFIVSQLGPFSANVQFQLLSCSSTPSPQIRVIINDGVAPLSSINGCSQDTKYGMCAVEAFTEGLKKVIGETDWTWDCHGDWNVPEGDQWHTVKGTPPARSYNKS